MFNEELIAKAKEAGVNHEDFKDEESLTKAINEKTKSKGKDDDDDVKDLDEARKEIKKFKEEAKKAFDARDELKKKLRSINSEVDSLKEKLNESPDKSEYDSLKKQLKELSEFKKEYDAKLEEEELKSKSEVEKTTLRFEKEFSRLKKEMEESLNANKKVIEDKDKELKQRDETVERLRRKTLRAEIIEAATKSKAYNPSQVARLLIDEFTYDDDLDAYFFYKKDSKGKVTSELDVNERVKEFLEDPENDNLVEAEVRGGTGQIKGESRTKIDNTASNTETGEKQYDPKDPDLIAAADLKGLSVEDHIRILKLRDKKLSKIRGKK